MVLEKITIYMKNDRIQFSTYTLVYLKFGGIIKNQI